MTFEESLRRLQPIIGPQKARQLWRAYQLEDGSGKRDMEATLALQLERLTGVDPLSAEQHLSVPSDQEAQGDYVIGEVLSGNRSLHKFGLREDEFIQHLAIFGRSGAGKTNTVALLIHQLVRHKKPFMIFDWKRNYRDLIKPPNDVPLEVYTVGRRIRPLHFNPLIPPPNTDVKVWLKKLIEIISHAYYLGEGVMFMLQEAFDQVYAQHGCYDSSTTQPTFPTMNDVLEQLQKTPVKGRRAMWLDSTLRAVQSLCFGQIADVINVSSNDSILDLLHRNTCLELNALGNAEKVFLIETLMLWIHHLRMLEPDRETFKHAIIIEEAHNILSPAGKETLIDTLLREVRELGESIILVDQHPSQISIPALGNTYCTIALNMKHSKDIHALGEIMQVARENRDLFGTLAQGRAIVKMQGRYVQPFQIQVPKVDIAKGSVSDQELGEIVIKKADSTDSIAETADKAHSFKKEVIPLPRKEEPESGPITPLEKALMEDIRDHPLDGVVRRYTRLGVSRRKGDEAKKSLIAKRVIQTIDIQTRTGKVVLLDFTKDMRAAFDRQKVDIPAPRRGGLAHMYWIETIRRQLVSKGWETDLETPIGHGQTVDLTVRQAKLHIAIEIETGDRGPKNIERLLPQSFDWILSFGINDEAATATLRGLKHRNLHPNHLLLARPADIDKKLDFLTAQAKGI